MKTSTIRRLILGAACGVAGVLAFSTPAHADDGTQQPGGVLGTVVEVVSEVLPEPTKEPEPAKEPDEVPAAESEQSDEAGHGANEPAAEPEPTPADQPTQAGDEESAAETPAPPSSPIEQVTDGLEQIVEPVKDVVEDVTTPLPVPSTPAPAPVVTPAPTEPTQPAETARVDVPVETETATEQPEHLTAEAPAVDPLPVLPVVGPVAGSDTMLPGLTPVSVGEEQPTRAPQCDERPAESTPDHGRGVVRTITDRRTGLPTASSDAPAKPCPPPAPAGDQAINAVATTGHAGAHSELYAATTTGVTWPTLDRLQQLRARGDLPASRSTHVEPGPA
ncbi:hypothetical protein [Micromonospora chokoriensis]|uniref:hypothetical protein n=1 Tax=Micromonospora chokoriensis TaxID=356851 RepID=UPI0004C34321|nr:hypothetical protein [Micromonospora chokoriensis]